MRHAARETGIAIRYVLKHVCILSGHDCIVLSHVDDVFDLVTPSDPGLHSYLQEYTNLGTAGGLYHFRDLISRGNPDAFFVLHGNVCSDISLTGMLLRAIPVSLRCPPRASR